MNASDKTRYNRKNWGTYLSGYRQKIGTFGYKVISLLGHLFFDMGHPFLNIGHLFLNIGRQNGSPTFFNMDHLSKNKRH